jgi:hypothetical protein
MPSLDLHRARRANSLVFFVAGAIPAAWATRTPAIKERLDLSAGELGLGVLGLEAGAVLGLPAGGLLVAHVGSPTGLRAGFAVFPAALVAVAIAPELVTLALALAAMAAGNSVVDVAMNSQGAELERRCGRPVLSTMHAGHPFGLAAGGLAGAGAAALGVTVVAHFAVAAALGVVVGLTATRRLVREAPPPRRRAFVRPSGPLLLLGVVAFCAFLVDGAAYNWSAVHLRSERNAGPSLAAVAFLVLSLGLAVGRLAGDRLVARFGRERVIRDCGLVAAGGAALAVAAPTIPLGLAGWAILGLGLAAVAPTVVGAAYETNSGAPSVPVATVTTIGYLGSFTGSPAIGAVAELSTLSAALLLLVVVSVGISVLGPRAATGARPSADCATATPRTRPRPPDACATGSTGSRAAALAGTASPCGCSRDS